MAWRWIALLCIMLVGSTLATANTLTGVGSGPGWIAIQADNVTTDTIHLELDQVERAVSVFGIDLNSGSGHSQGFELIPGGTVNVGADVASVVIGPDVPQDPETQKGFTSATRHVSYPDARSVQVMFWYAGSSGSWTWSASSENSSWRVVDHADGAIFWNGAGHAEGTHAHASVIGTGFEFTNATYVLPVSGVFRGLVGYQSPQESSRANISMTYPDGHSASCTCIPAFRGSPGNYLIHWDGVDAGIQSGDVFLAAGVDAPDWIT